VGSYICQNGELVDVRVVFRIDVCELGMESRVAGSRQTGIPFVDLDEGITFVEVDIVVVSGQP
jgi:hypothetical protein